LAFPNALTELVGMTQAVITSDLDDRSHDQPE
jgi:hypothetical protein